MLRNEAQGPDLHGVLVLPGLLAHEELPQDDAKAVDVALLIVALYTTQYLVPLRSKGQQRACIA